MFLLQVNKNLVSVRQTESMTSGSQNVYVCQFEFSDEWDYLERVAVFATDVGPDGPIEDPIYNQILKEDNRCFIPWEVNKLHNKHVYVGVFGAMNGQIVLPTIWVDIGAVLLGVTTGIDIEPPTPTLYQQLLSELNAIRKKLDLIGNGPDLESIAGHGLKVESDKLLVNAVDGFLGDNTLPITAAAVHASIGNIEALLETI